LRLHQRINHTQVKFSNIEKNSQFFLSKKTRKKNKTSVESVKLGKTLDLSKVRVQAILEIFYPLLDLPLVAFLHVEMFVGVGVCKREF